MVAHLDILVHEHGVLEVVGHVDLALPLEEFPPFRGLLLLGGQLRDLHGDDRLRRLERRRGHDDQTQEEHDDHVNDRGDHPPRHRSELGLEGVGPAGHRWRQALLLVQHVIVIVILVAGHVPPPS
ncbi:MAG: hypothetical protein ACYTKD_20610, partial [Planctomycetota bacterium]